jgi:2-polyprenyl-6-methoxyphenol hydroxylase-like FAD-dependent oxidoreductase
MESDVIVAGAGPTGLTLACVLRGFGVGVRVIDRAAGPAVTSRANFVHARGSEVLDRVGALGDLPDRSRRAMQITTYLGDRPVMRLKFGDPGMQTAAPPMVISQAEVEAALRDRLTELGGRIEWDTALVGIQQDADQVKAELSTGEIAGCRWLVGCDGTSSQARKAAGIAAPGVRLSEQFLLADLRLDWDLDRSGTSGWIHPSGMLGAMPMPHPDHDQLWRLLAYDPSPDGVRVEQSEDDILQRFREILPERTGDAIKIIDALWLSDFVVHRRLADAYRSGRIFLAGDAAHAHAPFGGQGMLTGIGDAENLGWKLAMVVRGDAAPALLETYQAERRPLARQVLRGTSAVTKIDIAEHPVGRFLRDHVIIKIFNLPAVQRSTTYSTSQLWVSYRNGPLGGRRLGSRPRPGDRVPDRACTTGDQRPTRLYAELGDHWALLQPANPSMIDSAMINTATRSLGPTVTVLSSEDQRQTWLIRPDGHLAWRGDDPGDLRRWLDSALRTGQVTGS